MILTSQQKDVCCIEPSPSVSLRCIDCPGNTKGGEYHCTIDLLFDWFEISCMTTDKFCFYLQNRLLKTSQTGGQRCSDTSPFSITWTANWLSMTHIKQFYLCMDKLELTGLNPGRVFNTRQGRACACHAVAVITKQPNLKLKTWPKHLLGLAFILPDLCGVISHHIDQPSLSKYDKYDSSIQKCLRLYFQSCVTLL